MLGPWGRAFPAMVLALGLAGCLPSTAVECDDGTTCVTPQVCAPAGGACVDGVQVEVCQGAGLADGDPCTLPGTGTGRCRDGVCEVSGCGDGVVGFGEVCDDGNDVETDGCTSACALPGCGDGFVQGDEACDDGAANGDARACTSACAVATCGDGFVFAGSIVGTLTASRGGDAASGGIDAGSLAAAAVVASGRF